MCDFPGKLIAWLDHELPEAEAAEVRRHVQGCAECQSRANAYEQVSKSVSAYCDETLAAIEGPGTLRWALAAAVLVVALLLSVPHKGVEQSATSETVAGTAVLRDAAPASISPAIAARTAPAPDKRIRRRRIAGPAQRENTNWASAEPSIQIAIPAEAMFPPGAVPEGINFVAELSIAQDGSAQRLRLQPRLVGWERRSQP
jgi:anti-sigma factor RsiW